MLYGVSRTEDENQNGLSPAVSISQVVPFVNRMKQQLESAPAPTLIDSWDSGDSDLGPDLVLTTYVTITEDAKIEDAETAVGLGPPPHTVTVTTELEQITVTVTAIPSNLVTLPASGTQAQTITATVTATPPGQVCTTIGTAVGVPIATGVAALFFAGGIYLWLIVRRRRRIDDIRQIADTTRLTLSDSDSPPAPGPVPCGRRCGGGGGGGGGRDGGNGNIDTPHVGIMAPPSSLASQLEGPLADGGFAPRFNQTSWHAVQRGSSSEGGGPGAVQSQRASYVSIQSTIPESDSSTEDDQGGAQPVSSFPARSNSIATVLSSTANGAPNRRGRIHVPMGDGEVVTFEDGAHGSGRTRFPNQLRTVIYVAPANGSGDLGPVIQAVRTAPVRPIEVVRTSQDARRSSTFDPQLPTSPRASVFAPTAEEPTVIAELEGSAVPRRFSSASRDGARGSASSVNSQGTADTQTLGEDGPFELSADNPILELGTDGAIPTQKTDDDRSDGSKKSVRRHGWREG